MTLIFFALLLPGARPAFAAEQHSLAVYISNGQSAYKQTVRLAEGTQLNHVAPAKDKWLIINGLLNRDSDGQGLLSLQYQLELSGGPNGQGRSIQVLSEAAIRPGDQLTVVECGPWTVKLELDSVKTAAKKSRGTAWNPGGLPNYRLTANVSAGSSRQQCKHVSRAGVQSNVADSITEGAKKFGFILNSLLSPADDGRSFSLLYQLEHGSNGAARPLQIQSEETLILNKKTVIPGEGYRLELLLEGKTPPKQAASDNVVKSDPINEHGTVQFLK
ncbi:MAG: hypothetical protein Q7R35_06585 [Elusimicrobiota bacterium]|nr:hypothetical protein [Elusimicrobiota bacterium]